MTLQPKSTSILMVLGSALLLCCQWCLCSHSLSNISNLSLALALVAAAGGGTQVTGATRVVIGAADDAAEVMRRAAAARACEVCQKGFDKLQLQQTYKPNMPTHPAASLHASSHMPITTGSG